MELANATLQNFAFWETRVLSHHKGGIFFFIKLLMSVKRIHTDTMKYKRILGTCFVQSKISDAHIETN